MSNALREAMARADAPANPNNYELDLNALRAIAHNAVYEAMTMRGRTRFSPLDALRADIIFRALADTPASKLADLERTAVIPSATAGNTPLLANMAGAVAALETLDTGKAGLATNGDANQAGGAGQAS